jgi:phage baseplate assembly protein W
VFADSGIQGEKTMIDYGKLLGRGMAFQPQLNQQNRIAWSEGVDNIREAMQIILTTEPGERLMLPDFGAGLKQFLFEPNTRSTHRLMEERIRQSLDIWEPRISVDSIDIRADEQEPRLAHVIIYFTLIATQVADQLQLQVQLGG